MREKIIGIIGGLGLGSLLNYLGINQETLVIFAVLLIADFIFGIVDVYIVDKTQIESNKAVKGVVKKVSKLLFPMIVVIVLKGAGFENVQLLTSSIMGILIVAEGYSIIGHIFCIQTGKKLPEIDGFEFAVQKVADLFKTKIDE